MKNAHIKEQQRFSRIRNREWRNIFYNLLGDFHWYVPVNTNPYFCISLSATSGPRLKTPSFCAHLRKLLLWKIWEDFWSKVTCSWVIVGVVDWAWTGVWDWELIFEGGSQTLTNNLSNYAKLGAETHLTFHKCTRGVWSRSSDFRSPSKAEYISSTRNPVHLQI